MECLEVIDIDPVYVGDSLDGRFSTGDGRDGVDACSQGGGADDPRILDGCTPFLDGVDDHDWFHGLKYRTASAALADAYRKAAAYRPGFDAAVRTQLSRLSELEMESCSSMDMAADAFAALLGSAAQEVADPVRRRVLEQLLYHLGRWVYLVDAADDLKKDAASGNYNPVALRFGLTNGNWTADARREFALSLDHSIRMMATAFELWDFGVWTPILEATIYQGLFRVGKAVLDGTFRTTYRNDERKKRKKVEEST